MQFFHICIKLYMHSVTPVYYSVVTPLSNLSAFLSCLGNLSSGICGLHLRLLWQNNFP